MNIFILDGTKMLNRDSAHYYISHIMHFPDYYGHNLDALYDCLGEYDESTTVIILNSDELLANLGEYGESLLETFRQAADEPYAFHLIINQ